MAGSQAVITHDETGQARFAAYYPPDIHGSQIIVAYCEQVSELTGRSLLVIDRAAHSVALAVEFTQHRLGLLSMLDDNEYHGLASFKVQRLETLANGTEVYRGQWSVARPDDPRQWVITVPVNGKPLVYWATEAWVSAVAMTQWPSVYRARNAIQENRFKRMIDHGALNTHYGRKMLIGDDRHQQRKPQALAQALQSNAQQQEHKAQPIAPQQRKVSESQSRGHGKRLVQRQRTLQRLETEYHALPHTQQPLTTNVHFVRMLSEVRSPST